VSLPRLVVNEFLSANSFFNRGAAALSQDVSRQEMPASSVVAANNSGSTHTLSGAAWARGIHD